MMIDNKQDLKKFFNIYIIKTYLLYSFLSQWTIKKHQNDVNYLSSITKSTTKNYKISL